MDRRTVASKFKVLLQSRGIRLHERERVLDALQRHHDVSVHFADAYLAASAVETKLRVASFDRDLDKFKDISRFDPAARR
jgi:predicted nucleic acid-binding protein